MSSFIGSSLELWMRMLVNWLWKKLVEKWITVRGFSFTNSTLEQYKQKTRKQLPNPRPYGLNCSQNNVYLLI